MAARDLDADGKKWAALHEDWVFASQAYRTAAFANTKKFMECAAGQGTGPTLEELDNADRLLKIADDKYSLTNVFLREVFG